MSSASTPPPYGPDDASRVPPASIYATPVAQATASGVSGTATAPPQEFRSHFWLGFGIGCGCAVVIGLIVGVVLALIVGIASMSRLRSVLHQAGASASAQVESDDASDGAGSATEKIDAALEEEDFDRAAELAHAFLRRQPDSPLAREYVATVRIEQEAATNPSAQLMTLLQDARESGIDIRPVTQLGVADALLSADEPTLCMEVIERLLPKLKRENDTPTRYLRGVAYMLRGMAKGASNDSAGGIQDLERAIKLAPDDETERQWRAELDDLRRRTQ